MISPTEFKRAPLAEQLAGQIEEEIRTGKLEPQAKLPGVRAIAQQYNVSLSTVLTALRLLEERQLIDREARRACRVRQGAVSDRLARRHGSHIAIITYGLVHRDLQDYWGGNVIQGIEHALDGRRFAVPMSFDYTPEGLAKRLLPRIDELGHDLAGAVIFSVADGVAPLAEELDRRGVPWVTIDPPHERAVFNFVTADNLLCGQRMGYCLGRAGFERIVILRTNIHRYLAMLDRVTGIYRGLLTAGVTTQGVKDIRCDSIQDETAYERTLAYLDENGPPDAIFVAHDMLAMGALRACRERGVRVPDDVSLVGCLNLPYTANWDPPLTVISQPMEQIGREAVAMIDQMHRQSARRLPGRIIPGRFIFRRSLRIGEELRRELETQDQQHATFAEAAAESALLNR